MKKTIQFINLRIIHHYLSLSGKSLASRTPTTRQPWRNGSVESSRFMSPTVSDISAASKVSSCYKVSQNCECVMCSDCSGSVISKQQGSPLISTSDPTISFLSGHGSHCVCCSLSQCQYYHISFEWCSAISYSSTCHSARWVLSLIQTGIFRMRDSMSSSLK